jgi:hypothetical protein
MSEEIINKVAQSGLITIDMEELYRPGERVAFDLKDWLYEELILREKDFREKVKTHDWSQYSEKYVALFCSADAIVPTWAFMIVSTKLQAFAKKIVFGDLKKLEESLFLEDIEAIDLEKFKDQRIVIKGCSKIEVPVSAYAEITSLLTPVVKSIMYGEPCSTVPVYKRPSL